MKARIRVAHKEHWCDHNESHIIRPGDRYRVSVAYPGPGDEAGYATAAGRPVRFKSCAACALLGTPADRRLDDAGIDTSTGAVLVDNMPEDIYHAHPALSASGAKLLLPPSCPAIFHYRRTHPMVKEEFNFGHAAHQRVLGRGAEIVLIDAKNYQTKAAQQARDEALSAGRIPLLPHQDAQIDEMAKALARNETVQALVEAGRPEQSIFWTDRETGVQRRARLDLLPQPGTGRLILADYKTSRSSSPEKFSKALHEYGYHQQSATYCDAAVAAKLTDEPAFLFFVQDVNPPYVVSILQPDAEALRIGRALNREAIRIFADCTTTNTWPGHADQPQLVSVPAWVANRFAEVLPT